MTRADVRQVVAWHRPLQWATCVALWVTFAASLLPELHLPLGAIAPAGFIAALLRTVLLAVPSSPSSQWLATASLGVDAVLLTGLLDITGGPFNPFVVIYAVEIWLAAVTLSTLASVIVGLAAVSSFGWLLLDHLQAGLAEHHRLNDFPTHLFTMWFAGALVADLVAHYVARARLAFAQQQRQLEAARERATRSERLASLTTLAAGAAHELSTPLATIAVAAKELERTVRQTASAVTLDGDIQLIRDAVERCRAILDGMSGRAADGAVRTPMNAGAIAELACAAIPAERRGRLRVDLSGAPLQSIDGGVDVSRALSSRLKNAFDAGGAEPVSLRATTYDAGVRFEVQDHGHGMTGKSGAGPASRSTRPRRRARAWASACSWRGPSPSSLADRCGWKARTARLRSSRSRWGRRERFQSQPVDCRRRCAVSRTPGARDARPWLRCRRRGRSCGGPGHGTVGQPGAGAGRFEAGRRIGSGGGQGSQGHRSRDGRRRAHRLRKHCHRRRKREARRCQLPDQAG
jgi:two-component system sensor histidine kinase RegB